MQTVRNRLDGCGSLYLRQHAGNPVHWQPWDHDAFALARVTDRPILLSIGYAACHWCHVMADESFADPETAALMNELFVCIKVDREERPDLDRFYLSEMARLGKAAGWPLTAFLSPDATVFDGGGYFPPEPRFGLPAFRDVLREMAAPIAPLAKAWRTSSLSGAAAAMCRSRVPSSTGLHAIWPAGSTRCMAGSAWTARSSCTPPGMSCCCAHGTAPAMQICWRWSLAPWRISVTVRCSTTSTAVSTATPSMTGGGFRTLRRCSTTTR